MKEFVELERDACRLFKSCVQTSRGATSGEAAYSMAKSKRLLKYAKRLRRTAKMKFVKRTR